MALCECGCGQDAGTVPYTSRPRGWVKGEPRRFIHGHNRRRKVPLTDAERRERESAWNRITYQRNRKARIAAAVAYKAKHRRPCKRCGGDKGAGRQRQLCDPCRALVREEYPMRRRMRSAARRARLRGQFVEHVHPLVVLERDDGACGICGGDVDPLNFDVDHIVAIARGGEHSYANVQVAHRLCNQRKWVHDVH
jgi:5-methylcytosine-specific restriction endonuclease McrA